ncbi:hypothetical protein GCM10027569_71920 [Flindersiella endophytica]
MTDFPRDANEGIFALKLSHLADALRSAILCAPDGASVRALEGICIGLSPLFSKLHPDLDLELIHLAHFVEDALDPTVAEPQRDAMARQAESTNRIILSLLSRTTEAQQ